ncbi:Mitochondrial sodium/calcium exchanger protein [Seminavis robusta]|uniref:Mitochondrial sodium/calcium exchanger protein n=1 Tax=Seminavis robusta TaxID=568900 RepID=A0A9N8HD89_9STRA|nr:Mitochondrial sodium/calcium exchanger protein [Seminavis robusta]|eukprot:Sro333_g119550.1 Mitochondrial sodium/calcium exchanger protein (706) ;mRNA; f:41308-43515
MTASSVVRSYQETRTQRRMDPTRHRFQTKMSLSLTAFALVGLTVLSLCFSSSNSSQQHRQLEDNIFVHDDYSGNSCHDLFTVAPDSREDQCTFARTCNDGAGIWLPFVFCSKRLSPTAVCAMLSPFVILWLILMFRLLGSTAEDYFSPSLEYFSVKAKLPPRFAGVTLLALGNGAADVSATINAVTSDMKNGYQMSLGALTGAAMFVGGVVSAVVILVAGGVPCRGALVRDVLMLFLTMIVIWVHFATGEIGPEAISLFLSLYGIFVLVVLVADAYHRGVVLPRQALQDHESERERQMQAAEEIHELASGSGTNLEIQQPPPPQQQQPAPTALGNVLSALSNYDRTPANEGWGVGADEIGQERPVMLHGARGIIRGDPNERPPLEGDEHGTPYSVLEDAQDRICAEPGPAGGSISYNWPAAFEEGKQEILDHAHQVWDDIAYNGDIHWAEKGMLFCELPFTFLRQVTVPIPCDGYYCRGLVSLSMAVSPIYLGLYLWAEHGVPLFTWEVMFYMGVLWAVAIGMGALVLRYAPAGEGNMALFAATPIALYGFIIGAMWVDAIADHLVNMLDFIGILLRIPGPVIGLTILAWGNSVADLSANVAMARKGLANMAMTACFAGPVFNLLIGLGLGFYSLGAKEGTSSIPVEITGSVRAGFIFVMLNCTAIVGVGVFLCHGRIPKQHGYLALSLYSVYVITSIALEYTKK